MREIHIQLPRDYLETLMREKQASVPFQTDELGFPLRIVIHGAAPVQKGPRFGRYAEEVRQERLRQSKEEDPDDKL